MRQAGILAAAALYALDNNVERLAEDHEKARYFAEGINEIEGISLDIKSVQTNIVVFNSKRIGKEELIKKLKKRDVLISSGSYDNMRAVFHMDVNDKEVENALGAITSLFNSN
jgi:threonine aldolase